MVDIVRAIGLANDVPREIDLLRHGSTVLAQSPISLNMSGYDPAYRSMMSEYSPTKARAPICLSTG